MLYSILPCALLLLPFYMYVYLKHTFLVSESSQPAGVILYKHPGQPLLHISTLQMWPTQYQSVFHWHSGSASADSLEWYGILFCTLAKFLNWCFQINKWNGRHNSCANTDWNIYICFSEALFCHLSGDKVNFLHLTLGRLKQLKV